MNFTQIAKFLLTQSGAAASAEATVVSVKADTVNFSTTGTGFGFSLSKESLEGRTFKAGDKVAITSDESGDISIVVTNAAPAKATAAAAEREKKSPSYKDVI